MRRLDAASALAGVFHRVLGYDTPLANQAMEPVVVGLAERPYKHNNAVAPDARRRRLSQRLGAEAALSGSLEGLVLRLLLLAFFCSRP